MWLVAITIDSSTLDFWLLPAFVKSISRGAWGLRAVCWQYILQLKKQNQSVQQRDLCSVSEHPVHHPLILQAKNLRVIHHFMPI